MKPVHILLIITLFLGFFTALPQPAQADSTNVIFLPVIFQPWALSPVLQAPTDGAVLSTLAPAFDFDPGTTPAGTNSCLKLGQSTPLSTCTFEWTGTSTTHFQIDDNLAPATTYFWQFCSTNTGQRTYPRCSPTFSFTTAPAGGVLPDEVKLEWPEPGGNTVLPGYANRWHATPGAIQYFLTYHNTDMSFNSFTYLVSENRYQPKWDYPEYRKIGHRFEWFVRARNEYGWGPNSEVWIFQVDY
ncbi:MAG TPA: hypothetical protein PKW33_00020 [Anaerolineaceae bacterium]|nr:hypothetical protein [Anaerolineaceae bacterium]HPN49943.1 hypothetical protein [Anaerolineaceae bacterium]